jgi:pantoate--beta-alanine ligase
MDGRTVFTSRQEIERAISAARLQGKSIGFVPTMGALHEGHIALVKRAVLECEYVVVSIFVNPTQFNNPKDLELYPRMLEKDLDMLKDFNNVVVFAPTVDQVYPPNDKFPGVNLEGLDAVLEGEFRPGHFQGVVHVVYNFFQIVQPDFAYFGLKDFQQVAVIEHMVRQLELKVKIIPCPTLREKSGLAMSSRNLRLTEQQKSDALIINATLNEMVQKAIDLTPNEVAEFARDLFNSGRLKLEYLEIVDPHSLQKLSNHWVKGAVCCIAAFCGDVRLIDNMLIKP